MMVTLLMAVGVAANVGFLADYLWHARRAEHGLTAHALLWSSLGSLAVLAVGLAELVSGHPAGALHWAVASFAALGYPPWWAWMRWLRSRRREISVEG